MTSQTRLKTITITLTRDDIDACLEWYRSAHHFCKCEKPIKQCHRTKKKMLEAAKEINAIHKGVKRCK